MKKVLLLCSLLFIASFGVAAAVTVTHATGGSALSANTSASAYTTLTGPTITETTAHAITRGNGTVVITAPTGFSFNTGVPVLATITRDAGNGGCFQFGDSSVTPTASTITYTLNTRDSNGNTPR